MCVALIFGENFITAVDCNSGLKQRMNVITSADHKPLIPEQRTHTCTLHPVSALGETYQQFKRFYIYAIKTLVLLSVLKSTRSIQFSTVAPVNPLRCVIFMLCAKKMRVVNILQFK